MGRFRLMLLALSVVLLPALFSFGASALSAHVYFDRSSESVGEGGVITFNIIYDNPDYLWVGGSETRITMMISGGNATYGSNYTATMNGVPFNPDGSATYAFTPIYDKRRVIPIEIRANNTISKEVYQEFTLSISGYLTYPGWPDTNTLYIDKLPAVQFQAGQESVNEGNAINIGVVRSGATYVSSSVEYAYQSNVSSGGIFSVSPVPQTLNFAPGETIKYITISTLNDAFFENDYNVTLRLQNPSGARLVDNTINNLTVISTSAAPTVQFKDTSESVTEGSSVNITLVRTGDIDHTISTVELMIQNETKDISDNDYDYSIAANNISNNKRITFGKGEAEKTITINADTNMNYEDTRIVNFTLKAVSKALIGTKSSNVLTINDNTPIPVIEFVAASESVDEGKTVNITLRRTGAANIDSKVYFDYYIADGDDGGKYSLSFSNMVPFNSGQTEVNLTVTTSDDAIYGNDYRLNFTLKDPVKATVGGSRNNTLTVHDTTPLPTIGFLIDRVSVEEGKSVNITLNRIGAKNIESIVSYRLSSKSTANIGRFDADPALDGQIIFSPNDVSKSIKITAKSDDYVQGNQLAILELYSKNGATIGEKKLGYVTIIDMTHVDPPPPNAYFDSAGASVNNGDICQLTIKRSANNLESNITLDRVDGSANSPNDYSTSVPLPYTVHFAVGEKSKTVTVSVNSSVQGEKTVTFGLITIDNSLVTTEPYTYTLAIHGATPTPTPTPEPTPTPTPEPDVKPLYVNANMDTEQIIVGYEGKITIKVTDGVNPVSGASVSIDRTGGQVIMLNPKTDGNGICYATFKSDNPGQYSLTVTATATGYDPGTATLTTSVVNAIPGSLTVNAMVKQQPVVIGSEADVTVSVMDGGTPVPGATISIETTSGSVTPSSGTTDSDGNMFATFHSADPGSYILTVTAAASGHPTSRVSYAVQVVSPEERHLYATMSIDPKSVSPNSKADVTVTVTDGVMPVSNAQVSLVSTGGTITPSSGVTDSDGKFAAQFSSGLEGTYTLGATAYSEGIGQASYSTYIKVKQSMLDMQLLMYFILAVIIIAVVLIILVTLIEKWMATDLRIVPKMGAIPADGMSRLPVRIEVFNGFGRPKKARSDTYVELEATAGRIESVTIPAGRSFADAVLMSSKEFGPVSIKAKIGDKAMASVPVEFKLEGGSLAVTITPGMIIADSKSSASINIRVRNSKGNYVVPLTDKVIELNTTLGDIVGSIVSMPARSNSANATIVSNKEGGIATVTATMGTLKGTGRVEFRSMSRQLCANCGQPIPGSLPVCPSCGKPAVSADDKKATASMN